MIFPTCFGASAPSSEGYLANCVFETQSATGAPKYVGEVIISLYVELSYVETAF